MARYPSYQIFDANFNLIFGIGNDWLETGLRPSDSEVVQPFSVNIVDDPFSDFLMGTATHITVDFDPTSGLDISLLRLEEDGAEPNPLIIDYVEMLYNTNQIGWGYGESYPYILSGGSETPEVTEGVGVSASGGLLLVGEWLVSCPSEIPDGGDPDGGDDNPPPNYITFTDQMVPVTDVGIEPLGFNHVVPMSGTTSTFDISFDRAITTENVIFDSVLNDVTIYSNDGILVADLGLRVSDFYGIASNTEYKGNNTYGLVAPMSTTLSDYNTVVYGTPVLVTNTTGVDLDLDYCRHWLTHYATCTDPVINTTNLYVKYFWSGTNQPSVELWDGVPGIGTLIGTMFAYPVSDWLDGHEGLSGLTAAGLELSVPTGVSNFVINSVLAESVHGANAFESVVSGEIIVSYSGTLATGASYTLSLIIPGSGYIYSGPKPSYIYPMINRYGIVTNCMSDYDAYSEGIVPGDDIIPSAVVEPIIPDTTGFVMLSDDMFSDVNLTTAGVAPIGVQHAVPSANSTSTFDVAFTRHIYDYSNTYKVVYPNFFASDGTLVATMAFEDCEYKGNMTFGLKTPISTTLSDYNIAVYGTPSLISNTTGVDLNLSYCQCKIYHYRACSGSSIKNSTNVYVKCIWTGTNIPSIEFWDGLPGSGNLIATAQGSFYSDAEMTGIFAGASLDSDTFGMAYRLAEAVYYGYAFTPVTSGEIVLHFPGTIVTAQAYTLGLQIYGRNGKRIVPMLNRYGVITDARSDFEEAYSEGIVFGDGFIP